MNKTLQQTWFTKGLWHINVLTYGCLHAERYNRPDLQRDYDGIVYPFIIILQVSGLQQTWFTKGLWPASNSSIWHVRYAVVTTDLIYKGIMTGKGYCSISPSDSQNSKSYNRPDLQRDYDSISYLFHKYFSQPKLQQTWFTKGLWPHRPAPIRSLHNPVLQQTWFTKGLWQTPFSHEPSAWLREVTTDLIYKGTSTSAP